MAVFNLEPTVSLTSRISEHIDSLLKQDNVDKSLLKELQTYSEQKTIPFRLVKKIHDVLSESEEKTCYLHELIEGSDVCLPEPEVIPRNPELEARCKRLQAQQENRTYKAMTRNIDKSEKQDYFKPGQDLKEINRQIVSVINFIVTVGGAFAFGYKATQYGFEGVSNVFALQMIAGLSLATLVFFADLYFLLREST